MKRRGWAPALAFGLAVAGISSACGTNDPFATDGADAACAGPQPDCRNGCNGDAEQAICNATYGWSCPGEGGDLICPDSAVYDAGTPGDAFIDDSSTEDASPDDASDGD